MTELQRLRELNSRLVEALYTALPIVEEAFWDHHTAGTMPGSGYHHRVYARVSEAFGWKTTQKFNVWKEALAEAKRKAGLE